MKINNNLYMVIPLYRGDDVYAYVHSAPISREIFEMNHKLLTRTFTTIIEDGILGARTAHLSLHDSAIGLKRSADPILNEIKRISNVVVERDGSYVMFPLEDALSQQVIDEEDVSEVMAATIFFTASWHVSPRPERMDLLTGGVRMWNAEISSLDITAFIASLRTSTVTASTGVNRIPASSVPF